MEIRLRENGRIVSDREFRGLHDNVSFPLILSQTILNDYGADPILEAPAPTVEDGFQAIRNGVEQDSKQNWVYAWQIVEKPPEPVVVPQTVTMRQARLALLGAGYLAAVEAAIAALPSPTKEAVQIEWEYAQEVERSRGIVAELGTVLGLSESELDNLFIVASKL